ncbi:glycosyltransferase family 2 protein [Spirosoma pollinicola]|nr:glycosyltransferase family 2 protein [Spirosoma pollinicola]
MKVSVCIPTYNQANYIEQAIRSAVQQTVQPWEIIVFDDCSTDATPQVLERLVAEIPFLSVVYQKKNLGITANADASLRACTGDFIVKLDSDDYLSPEYVEKVGQLFAEYPDAGYIHTAVDEVDQHGKLLQEKRLFRKSGFQSSTDALKSTLKGYRVTANIIMYRRTALEKLNYLAGRSQHCFDYHLAASMCAAGYGNVYLDEILSSYRVWTDKFRSKRKYDEITGIRQVFEEVIEPAFSKQNWKSSAVKNSRTDFACQYANCLSWTVYNNDEKKALVSELHKLSSAPKARMFSWLYLNGFGNAMSILSDIQSIPRSIFKTVLLRFKMVGALRN